MKRRIEPFEAPRIGSRAELINGTWYWIDDQPEPDSDKCPSCGVPYTEHLGLIGTCKRVKELTADRDRLHVLLSCAHGALADCSLPVPGMDQDIAPVIRKLTEERDRYKRLAGELALAIDDMLGNLKLNDGKGIGIGPITRAKTARDKYRKEGVTE